MTPKTYKALQIVLSFAWAIGMLAIIAFVTVFAGGCAYKGGKVTEGTDLAVGLNVPMTEGTLQLQVLNYLSGFRVGVDRNAIMRIHYTVAESNDYLGVVHTRTAKTADVTVEPCEISQETPAAADDKATEEIPDDAETR